jgi:hypothetical protein
MVLGTGEMLATMLALSLEKLLKSTTLQPTSMFQQHLTLFATIIYVSNCPLQDLSRILTTSEALLARNSNQFRESLVKRTENDLDDSDKG